MTRDEVVDELRATQEDLRAFEESRNAIQRRINDMEGSPRQDQFVSWAATQVILNGLILAITRCHGLTEDYRSILERMDVPLNVIDLVKRAERNKK